MPLPSDPALSPGDIMRRLAELERLVRLLAAGRGLESSGVGGGGITLTGGSISLPVATGSITVTYDAANLPFLLVGELPSAFGPIDQLTLRRHFTTGIFGNTRFLQVQSNIFGFESWAGFDANDQIIVGDDGSTGDGLGRPYLPQIIESVTTPTDSTAGGVFVTLLRSVWRKQHHSAEFWVRHNVTATTGEIRFVIGSGPDTGTVIGGPTTISGSGHNPYGPFTVPGVHGTEFFLDVQGRVASGAGATAVRAMGYGVGSI